MSDWITARRATIRPLPQAVFVNHLNGRKPNKVTEHAGETCVVCADRGIITPLSRFNPNRDFCFTHTPMEPEGVNAKHVRGSYVVCRQCTQQVHRSEFIARRGRCRKCDQKAA